MSFSLPAFMPPDVDGSFFQNCPVARFEPAPMDGVAPENYHGTSVYPEYVRLENGAWQLPSESRMDCVIVRRKENGMIRLDIVEPRRLKAGDMVAVGRGEEGEDGIYVHTEGFRFPGHVSEKFAFRSQLTRETSFSIDYDELYDLLRYEKDSGHIVWVLGPAVVFDHDARAAFSGLVENGFVQGLLAGNALATHDLEGSLFKTALGQELYSKTAVPMGHYKHLDTLNRIRAIGSMEQAVADGVITDGVMRAIIQHKIPYVLAASIRDDGPLPEVVGSAAEAQDRMRGVIRKATTVITLATQLHAIAVGNMTPSYHVLPDGGVRPVYFYTVDMSEFAVNKLANRGSLTARSILTNVQDFVVTVARGLLPD